MINATLQILEDAAEEILRRQKCFDPELRELEASQNQLYQEFFRQHRHNPALRRQVLRLLDAQSAADAAKRELFFCLGLQMGLELQARNFIPPRQ